MRIAWFSALSCFANIAQSVPISSDGMVLAQTHSKHILNGKLLLKRDKSIFDQLGNDTIEAVAALQMLGGVDAEALDNWQPEPVPLPIGIPEEHKCCCWGQPIGDKLLQIADNLDPYGDTILAQISANSEGQKRDKD